MEQQPKKSVIVYRLAKTGLEVLLLERDKESGTWSLPESVGDNDRIAVIDEEGRVIELDPVELEDGILEQAYAVEADWHDIPSLKSILKNDYLYAKNTVRQMVPNMMNGGTYFAIKEAFKRVLPHQYKMLKELKDIISDRNSTRYM